MPLLYATLFVIGIAETFADNAGSTLRRDERRGRGQDVAEGRRRRWEDARATLRSVPLVDQLVPYIDRADEWQDPRQPELLFPGRWTKHAQQQDGAPMSMEHARRTMKELCIAADVPAIDPYGLRHFYAAALVATGDAVSESEVKDIMAHRRISTTLDLYGHLWETDLSDRRQALTAIFGGATSAPGAG